MEVSGTVSDLSVRLYFHWHQVVGKLSGLSPLLIRMLAA